MNEFLFRHGRRIDLSGLDCRKEEIGETKGNRPWDLTYANLSASNLSEMELNSVPLIGSLLINANLAHSQLDFSDMSEADLSSANLYKASLHHVGLGRANLTGADLYGADLYGADLEGANFSGANLTGADMEGVELNRETNFAGANGLEAVRNPPRKVLEEIQIQARKNRYYTFLGGIKESPHTSLRQLYNTKREECIPLREIAQLTGLKKPVSFSTRRRSKKKKRKKSKRKSRKRKR